MPKKYKFLKNIPLNLYAGKKPLQSCFQNPLKGMLDVFQSAGICNRCGVCNQACPSYRALQAEVYSPRGRNQLFRLITDRKLSSDIPKKDVLVPVETCLLCGNCTAACAAYAPANKHVKLIKDALGKNIAGLFKILRLKFFTACPALLFTIKNIKYKLPFDSKITAVYLPSEEGLKHSKTTVKEIKKTNETLYTIKSGLLLTEAAMTADFKILKKTLGNILKEYITLLSPEPLVIITDNIEEYRILKQAREISQDFAPLAANVKFITDYIKPQKMKNELFKGKKVVLQKNNIFFYDSKVLLAARALFDCGKGDILVELEEGGHSAGLLAYTKIKGEKQIKAALAKEVAEKRTDYFVTFSSKDEKFFNDIFKKYYPRAKAVHIISCMELFYDK